MDLENFKELISGNNVLWLAGVSAKSYDVLFKKTEQTFNDQW